MGNFLEELKRRKVIRAVAAYVIVGWLLIQVAETTFEPIGLPPWGLTLVIVLIVMGLPLAAILAWGFDITASGIEKTPKDAAATVASEGPSLAVLPFPDMSAEHDQEHFCDGLTEELLNVLSRIPKLRVASRTSSFSFKGKATDLKSAAEKLQVAHILEGSVRKSGKRIRVTAQLIEAASDSHLWSETYDRELDDIFAR
jgi:TolB-like protein